MNDLVKKLTVGLTTGAVVAQTMIVPAFGAIQINVGGNGSETDNTVNVTQATQTVVSQTNDAVINNSVGANANSGNNNASDNTGGDVSVDTGMAQSAVQISNMANHNSAVVGGSASAADIIGKIVGNGTESENEINLGVEDTTFVTQDNVADVANNVGVSGNSGFNQANDNTGGSVEVSTGKASAVSEIENKLNKNDAVVGNGTGNNGGALWLEIGDNGSNSASEINVDLASQLVLTQTNAAAVLNSVGAEANSGNNNASDNTGGSGMFAGEVSIDTGAALTAVVADTEANFNTAVVEDAASSFDGIVKIDENGTESQSLVNLLLSPLLAAVQDNLFDGGANDLGASANSGENLSADNTAGSQYADPSVDTGNASTAVEVSTTANHNVFSTGDVTMPSNWNSSNWMMAVWGMMGWFNN